MLVLSRKVREAVLIGDEVVITVTRVKGRTVRLAIDAPQGISIARLDLPRSAESGDDHGKEPPPAGHRTMIEV
jgi:carbon storage regulator